SGDWSSDVCSSDLNSRSCSPGGGNGSSPSTEGLCLPRGDTAHQKAWRNTSPYPRCLPANHGCNRNKLHEYWQVRLQCKLSPSPIPNNRRRPQLRTILHRAVPLPLRSSTAIHRSGRTIPQEILPHLSKDNRGS